MPARMARMSRAAATSDVTLFGTILDSAAPGTFILDVQPQMGDAPAYSLGGQISLLRRQCCAIIEAKIRNGYDLVRIPSSIAQLKSGQARIAGKKRGKRG
jgi:hypothetical protein